MGLHLLNKDTQVLVEKAPFLIEIKRGDYIFFDVWYKHNQGQHFMVRQCTREDIAEVKNSQNISPKDLYIVCTDGKGYKAGAAIYKKHCIKLK